MFNFGKKKTEEKPAECKHVFDECFLMRDPRRCTTYIKAKCLECGEFKEFHCTDRMMFTILEAEWKRRAL